eukprot:gb/GEZJ01005021.1/.p1 GENE.gb/GEZJ01005021.1/~~gb/GEZJ01005021.1/.p1  ORF type:complete len:127 (+),score=4.14 gb/GEZJ01005021.1/:992-1372(+)
MKDERVPLQNFSVPSCIRAKHDSYLVTHEQHFLTLSRRASCPSERAWRSHAIGTNQIVTYSKCEVRGDGGLCRIGFKDLWGVHDHVQWGSGNYSLKGIHSGAFTPKIIHKDPDFYDAAVGSRWTIH